MCLIRLLILDLLPHANTVMMQLAQDNPPPLVIPNQLYPRGICLLQASATADSSRDKPRFGMTSPLGFQTAPLPQMGVSDKAETYLC
jgi:hypothetical protein